MVEQDPESRETGRYLALAQAGVEMVAPLLVGVVLDYVTNWGPWLTVVGAVVGFVGGTIHLIMMAKQMEREDSRKKQDGK